MTQRISQGVDHPDGDIAQPTRPFVIVECTPLPLKARAHLFRDGLEVITPAIRRVPPESFSPRVITHNYLNLLVADQEARRHNPKAWAILFDVHGYLSEGLGSNFFLVQNGTLYTPKDQYVLCGISRETVIEEAAKLGLPVVKEDLDLYDAYNADKVFITSTSFCICPVRTVNGVTVGDGSISGPLTKRLTDAYIELVNFDFVGQFLKFLE